MRIILALGLILGLFFGCSDNNPANNDEDNTTHISAGVKGKLVDANNNPVSRAVVRLFRVDYVPSISAGKTLIKDLDTTDEDGVYEIPNVDTGTYNLEGQKDTLGVFIDSINVPDNTSITNVPPGQLKKHGTITGITHMPGQSDTNQVRVNIYIPGTRRITLPNIGGRFTFDQMPSGRYQIIINPTLPTYNVKIIDTTLNAGELLDLDTIKLTIYEPDTIDLLTQPTWGTWVPDKKYRIYADIEIPVGKVLTILPGTQVFIAGFYSIIVSGKLDARGTIDSPIVFKPYIFNQRWNKFLIQTDTLDISYCIFDNQDYAFEGSAKIARIHNCAFRYGGHVLRMYASDTLLFYNNIVHDLNPGSANNFAFLLLNSSIHMQFTNNIFFDNLYSIFKGQGTADVILENNCFYNNTNIFADTMPSINIFPINDDPQFEDTTKGAENYHLKPISPCIGTGKDSSDMGIYSIYEP